MEQQRFVKSNAVLLLEKLALKAKMNKLADIPEKYLLKPQYKDNSANGLTACIVDFINLTGGQAERISSSGRVIDNRKTFIDVVGRKRTIGTVKWIKPNTTNGTADISATIQGRSVKVEIKCKATYDCYQSKAQKSYQHKIEAAGGIYFIATDFQSFYEWFVKHFNYENK
jgi:hypothetical protein